MIGKSVGAGGVNEPNDVRIVQCGLNVMRARNRTGVIAIDGLVGPQTIGAIRDFQRANGLTTDGRMDRNGPAITRLKAALGSEAVIFGPVIAQLLPLRFHLSRISETASGDAQSFANGLVSDLTPLQRFSDLASGFAPRPSFELAAFRGGGNVIGFVGVDDATVGVIVIGFFLAMMLIIMVESPAFRQAVEARAKELDRIMKTLQISMNLKFEEAVSLIESIADESIDASKKCGNSPTFNPSPECKEAIRAFIAVAARVRKEIIDVKLLISLFNTAVRGGRVDVRHLRLNIENFLRRMQQNAVDLQTAQADMRDKCNCPEI
jgi:peptidoglycan hydrolase-like protein with peptidoglycan-binding domain